MDSSCESGAALALDDGKVLQMDALVRAVTPLQAVYIVPVYVTCAMKGASSLVLSFGGQEIKWQRDGATMTWSYGTNTGGTVVGRNDYDRFAMYMESDQVTLYHRDSLVTTLSVSTGEQVHIETQGDVLNIRTSGDNWSG